MGDWLHGFPHDDHHQGTPSPRHNIQEHMIYLNNKKDLENNVVINCSCFLICTFKVHVTVCFQMFPQITWIGG